MAATIERVLTRAGLRVVLAADGEAGLRAIQAERPGAVVLDAMMPRMDGWTALRELRARRDPTPVLMLTALAEVADRVRGLEEGADDYLPKPFANAELVARVRALLRREQIVRAGVLRVGDLEVDRKARAVRRGGVEIALTRREFDLLEALAANAGRTMDKETIQRRVWEDHLGTSNTVEVYIASLRKKIETDPARKLLHTVTGFGYVLRDDS